MLKHKRPAGVIGANRSVRSRGTSSLALAAALLFAGPAWAAPSDRGPLPPGKPAGVHQAEINEVPYLLITAAATIALGMLVLYPHSNSTAAAAIVSTGTA